MYRVEAIIFDVDGTLVDSSEDIARSVNFTLRSLGLEEKNKEEIVSYVGTGAEDLIKKALGKGKKDLLGRGLSIFEEYYKKHSTDNSVLYPGVRNVLEHFKNKKKMVVTNRKRGSAITTLKALGIEGYFEDIAGADDITCMKPSACPLNKLIDKFKTNKDSSIIVGDMDIDILSGKNTGILTCGVTYGIGKKEDILKARPDFIIHDILELKKLIM